MQQHGAEPSEICPSCGFTIGGLEIIKLDLYGEVNAEEEAEI